MEAEILRNVQQYSEYYGRWREMAPGDYWQATKRRFRHINNIFFISCLILVFVVRFLCAGLYGIFFFGGYLLNRSQNETALEQSFTQIQSKEIKDLFNYLNNIPASVEA